ncbi:hypothetical protein D3C73_904310 [compost metagenome]
MARLAGSETVSIRPSAAAESLATTLARIRAAKSGPRVPPPGWVAKASMSRAPVVSNVAASASAAVFRPAST